MWTFSCFKEFLGQLEIRLIAIPPFIAEALPTRFCGFCLLFLGHSLDDFVPKNHDGDHNDGDH